MIRPLFSFFGGKWRLAPKYPEPAHPTIVEPFAGSAGYSCRYPDRRVVLVERDPTIAALWRWLISVPSAEVLALPLLEVGEPVPTGLREEARTLMGFWCCIATTYPRRRITKGWGQTTADRFWGARIRARVASDIERIRHWTIIEGDYTAAPDIRATWFVDPPYVGRQMRSKYGAAGGVQVRAVGDRYRFGTRRIDYEQLGRWCRTRRGLVVACDAVGATWMDFRPFHRVNGVSGHSEEAVWISSEHGVQLPLLGVP